MFVFLTEQYDPSHYENTLPHSILQVPTTQLAKMSIDPKFVELTADVLEIFLSSRGGGDPDEKNGFLRCPYHKKGRRYAGEGRGGSPAYAEQHIMALQTRCNRPCTQRYCCCACVKTPSKKSLAPRGPNRWQKKKIMAEKHTSVFPSGI